MQELISKALDIDSGVKSKETTRITIDDLVPSGALDEAADKIENHIVINDTDFAVLVKQATEAIDKRSRFNGTLVNITKTINVLRNTLLPIVTKFLV